MKKFLSIVLAVAIIICAVPLGTFTFTASALSQGYYKYEIENGAATITDVSISISGSVVIPSTLGGYPVISIGDKAFFGCRKMTGVKVPNTVISIGEEAFYDCLALSRITIPDSVTSIGRRAFFNTAFIKAQSNWQENVLYIDNHLICANWDVSDQYDIKDGTVNIAESAFSNCNFKEVNIPDSVVAINELAFAGCDYLSDVHIGNNVKDIERGAFESCYRLDFITIPESVTNIGEEVFEGCKDLRRITVSEDNKNYSSVDGVLFDKTITKLIRYPIGRNISAYNIPNTVTIIDNKAFNECETLRNVTIPDSVTSIGSSAFGNCNDLTIINVSENNEHYLTLDGVLFDKSGANLIQYPNGKKDLAYVVPDGVKTICDYSFYRCSNISTVYLPETVTSIGDYAFGYCTGLRTIFIPNTVISIGENAFYCWYRLVICGLDSSYVENYANENKISFFVMFNNMDQNGNNVWENVTVDETGVYDARVLLAQIENDSSSTNNTPEFAIYDKNGSFVYYDLSTQGFPLVKGEKYIIVAHNYILAYQFSKKTDTIFPDTSAKDWYNDAVTYAVGAGIMGGYQNGLFGTSDSIQRQDFLVMLARLDGVNLDNYKYKSSFPDVARNSYYEAAVNWGAKNGIVTGYDSGKFGVGDKVTREQLVTFLYRYAKYKGYDYSYTTDRETTVSGQYIDYKNVSGFAKDSILWAIEKGVISGKTSSTIVPQGNAQRCETAKIMYNIYVNDIFK